jgi:hypothetical protein
MRRRRGEFFCFLARDCQNRLPSPVNNLNGKVPSAGQKSDRSIAEQPPWCPCDPEPNLTCSFNVRQVKGLRVFDAAAATAKEKVVLGHSCMLSYRA